MVSSTLGIPDSPGTVSVKILNAAQVVAPASLFFDPVHPEHLNMTVPAFSFLIEHHLSRKRVVFDLGARKDADETSTPAVKGLIARGFKYIVEKDVATQLTEGHIPLESINAIIWSHAHTDHSGDPATFPSSTDLVVGPGFKEKLLPLYPTNSEARLFEKDIAGRTLTEISFGDTNLAIAGMNAMDYFGDGSFYLLDTPGHCVGHMVGLARVTAGSNPTFILLGGDICHHAGQLRPSSACPCPESIYSSQTAVPTLTDKTTPPLKIKTVAPYVHHDPHLATSSLLHVQLLDGEEDIFVILAHDASLKRTLKFFPEEANGWKEEGWKERSAWAFLEKGNAAYRFGPS